MLPLCRCTGSAAAYPVIGKEAGDKGTAVTQGGVHRAAVVTWRFGMVPGGRALGWAYAWLTEKEGRQLTSRLLELS